MNSPLNNQFAEMAQAFDDLADVLDNPRPVLEEQADYLERIHIARFDAAVGPRSEKWAAYSPLTIALYQEEGRPLKQGGTKLRGSFQRGGEGHQREFTKYTLTWGSALFRNGHYVVDGFQDEYSFPKTEEALAKVRWHMLRTVGIAAPGSLPGSKGDPLFHPSRKVVGLEPEHDEQLANIYDVWIEDLIDIHLGDA